MAMSSRSASTSEGPRAGGDRPGRHRRHADRQPGRPFPTCCRCVGFRRLHLLRGHPPGLEALEPRRHSGPRLVSHHRFNEAATTPTAIARPRSGATIALVTDAGTPLVSDPGAAWCERPWPRVSPSKPCPALRRLWPPWSCPGWPRSGGASRVSCPVRAPARRAPGRCGRRGRAGRRDIRVASPAPAGPRRPRGGVRPGAAGGGVPGADQAPRRGVARQPGRGRRACSGGQASRRVRGRARAPGARTPRRSPSPELGAVSTAPM